MLKNKFLAILLFTLSPVVWADDDCAMPPNADGCPSEGLAPAHKEVGKTSKWGFVNEQGKTVIPFKYEDVGAFKDGIASATLKGKSGFIDTTGKTIIPFSYDVVGILAEDMIAVGNGKKQGFINKQGKAIIPLNYQVSMVGGEGDGNSWKSVDDNYFSEGLASVKKNNKWGYIDASGKQIIGFKYDAAGGFSEGLAEVMIGDEQKVGFIDKTGKMVIPAMYRSVWEEASFYKPAKFKNGIAKVQTMESEEICITKQNKTVSCGTNAH